MTKNVVVMNGVYSFKVFEKMSDRQDCLKNTIWWRDYEDLFTLFIVSVLYQYSAIA